MGNNKLVTMIELAEQAAEDVSFYEATRNGITALITDVVYGYEAYKELHPDASPDKYAAMLSPSVYRMTRAKVNQIPEV